MRILIVDDSLYKITAISKVIMEEIAVANIITADSIEKGVKMIESQDRFNLAIVDLKVPLKANMESIEDGGKKFLNELYRKDNTLKIPNYIIGCTQFDIEEHNFSPIWKVIKYTPENNRWESSMKNLLKHIKNTGYEHITPINKPHLFVEGLTDKKYIEKAFELFSPDNQNKIQIEPSYGSGSNGLASNICIWAMKHNYDYKAMGLFDSDESGNFAIQKIRDRNLSVNESKCIVIHQLKPSYNEELKKFYQKGCKIEIEIEQLFPLEILQFADSRGWLEYRNTTFIEHPTDWNQHAENSSEFLTRFGFDHSKQLYIKKIKMFNKEDFSKFVLDYSDLNFAFSNFKNLVRNIEEKLLCTKIG
ncbi:response regulator [Elizabethkingia miricola]|uniref:Response regulator n=1 Tax=Elizabethkingia miricola TaxID=172045 RepID=A0ABD5B2V2_ELIMR|nr:response regulator [Elizabethkingia miricola]MDQ8747734.1 response regulator [Elizabethkingia miricola]